MNLRTALAILMLGAAAASFWFVYQPVQEVAVSVEAAGPDMVMDRFTTMITDDSGRGEYLISGDRLERLRPDGQRTVQRVSVLFDDGLAPPVTMDAATALISPHNDDILMSGDVVIVHGASGGETTTRILTPRLILFPERQEASTDAPVRLTRDTMSLDAVGMRTDLRARTVAFYSQVRASYER